MAKKSKPLRKKRSKKVTRMSSAKKSQTGLWPTTETALIAGLDEDLLDAWQKLKAFALELGRQRFYASGKAMMFAKKVCYFFVRPKKKYLEVVIFLPIDKKLEGFHSVTSVSTKKFAHTFRLIHADQVEGQLTDAVIEAFGV